MMLNLDIFLKTNLISKLLEDKKKGLLSEGYLFYGADKETNKLFLKSIALTLLCENNHCLKCPDCIKIIDDTHPDVIYFPKGNSFAVSDSKLIIEEATKKPMIADKKIIVINDIDNSSEEAQNKLLKVLEEPPKNVYFIASCTKEDNVLPTIKSRMIKQYIKPFSIKEIKQYFQQYENQTNFEFSVDKGSGLIGLTQKFLTDDEYLNSYNLSLDIICNLKNSAYVLDYVPPKMDRQKFVYCLENLLSFFRDILYINNNLADSVKNIGVVDRLKQVAKEYSNMSIVAIMQKIIDAKIKEESNVSISLIFELLLVSILEDKYLWKQN